MPLLELPHWLIVAGACLVVVGFVGMVFGGPRKTAEYEPELLPGDLDAWKAEQQRSTEEHRSAA
ncbi:hypothetical protein JQ633_27745 [Bradyrhizobium tropiciagri]|uniref:hypothetical protein n=1 Tax=Bradyrhizobium tropiciagri TaxID=312253 RepID=UPI001BA55783|nr:hypothetical protein [Bradyrhizobium tropiciagri]MBR0874183.1 hypothetical protein [Bradyrhizobium tropiciagri]